MSSKTVFVLTQNLQNAFKPGTKPVAPSFTTQDNQENSALFRLPAELRNRIYDLALGPSYSAACCRTHSSSEIVNLDQAATTKPRRELLLSCRRIYGEARNVSMQARRDFWRTNTFFVELRQDWTTTEEAKARGSAAALTPGEPRLDFPTIERCELLSIPNLIVLVDAGTYKCEIHFKANEGNGGKWILKPVGTTASRPDVISVLMTTPKEHHVMLKSYASLESKFKSVERYAKQAASYFSIAAKRRRLSPKEQHFAEMLEASLKPYKAKEREWDMVLNPNRVQLKALLKIMHQKHQVFRNPQLAQA